MIRILRTTCFALLLGVSMSSCFVMQHTVGNGAQGNNTQKTKQWYALWGLVPINDVNTEQMAGGSSDYTITTKQSFGDGVISIFTGIATISPRTVEVKN